MSNGPTTRHLCPLCEWHHDSRALPDLIGLSGNTFEDIIRAGLERQQQQDEATVQAHLETHELAEWVEALAEERQDRADAARGLEIAMDEWGKSDRHHAEKSVAAAAERGAWGTTRMRVWNAALVADAEDVTDWQRGYRACSERVMAALDEPVDTVTFDFDARPLPTPATPSRTTPDKAVTSSDAADNAGEP